MSTDVVLLDAELVDERCPLHADLELGDLSSLNAYDRKWLFHIACPELHQFYATARRSQLELREDIGSDKREFLGRQLRLALKAIDQVRREMTRIIAGLPRPSDRPLIDLWAR